MTGQNSPGDDGGGVDNGSDGLSDHSGMSERWCGVECHWGRDDRWGDDRAKAMADGDAGQTTGSGESDSHDGSEDSL